MEKNKSTYITHLLLVGMCVTAIFYPFIYKGQYAGDAQIHLVYGENASHGHFFEFNLGEKSSGVTGPGYMLLLALLFKVFPIALVPLVIKSINYAFWYGLVLVTYYLAALFIENKIFAYVITFISAILPGSVYNSTRGMENGIFGFVFILIIYLIASWKWFAESGNKQLDKEIILGILMGFAVWLRPEGFIVFLLLFFYRLFCAIKNRRINIALKHSVLFLIPFMVLTILLIYFHFSSTGDLLPTSGKSRMVMGRQDGISYGPIIINFKFLVRLIYYFPLSIFFAIGALLTVREYRKIEVLEKKDTLLYDRLFAVIVFVVFFFLYSTVLGCVHLGRYIIFIMPLMVTIAGYAAYWLWENWREIFLLKYKIAVFGFLSLSLLVLFVVETYYRFNFSPHDSLKIAMQAPELRERYSKSFLDKLGSPSDTPVSLACQEVQIRYLLDQRFVIRSLDGRVDPMLLDYYHDGDFDHIGYIKARNVNYIMQLVNYNKNADAWSLADLKQLSLGETTAYQGLIFKCVCPEIIQVIRTCD